MQQDKVEVTKNKNNKRRRKNSHCAILTKQSWPVEDLMYDKNSLSFLYGQHGQSGAGKIQFIVVGQPVPGSEMVVKSRLV